MKILRSAVPVLLTVTSNFVLPLKYKPSGVAVRTGVVSPVPVSVTVTELFPGAGSSDLTMKLEDVLPGPVGLNCTTTEQLVAGFKVVRQSLLT